MNLKTDNEENIIGLSQYLLNVQNIIQQEQKLVQDCLDISTLDNLLKNI